ncbi:alkaline phosphatase family protein [Alloacidobacterium dinghuense]|uniref:Alkaline phosphatase family protein n=1 Tax=Alloacidobacterium dinghuense TaxID=2763107 RepID=A0A7G8BMT3_9BACT|nr:alkaline phosphatase family protein [Alloacidobacterium dinghuense]QNI33853.1 alkaline phosphatase family protein [Alloacidobacterium dinghuense]
MKSYLLFAASAAALAVLTTPARLTAQDASTSEHRIKHVLLISIDGMHAVDYLNCTHGVDGVNGGEPYCPNLAVLGRNAINYTAASTSKPSDSFPGLMSIVTGATPKTMGIYYDVSYDRSLDAPAKTTGNGVAAGPCTPFTLPTGTTTEYEEGIDIDQTKVNGGAPGASLTDGGIASIDPKRLPRDPAAGCAPVFPWNFVRVNTIFGVIHAAGGYAAWSDKHPAYSSVAGPGGVLDDFYAPEINSNVIALPGVTTSEGVSCKAIRDPSSDLTAWTNSFQNIQCYDTLKVNAILNQIHGRTHNGHAAKMPTIFGMNFQAVSVGQKLIENGVKGGYQNAAGAPSASLLSEIEYVDASIGDMVSTLKDTDNFEDTLIIITAKHGQSPIDLNLYQAHPGKTGNGTSPAHLLASLLPDSESPANPNGIGPTEDDISLLWLKPGSDVESAVQTLEQNPTAIGLGQIFYGPTVSLNYNTPGLGPGMDPRTPDIIVTPNVGVTYTGSAAKLEEHGGFSHDDTNVMLLVSNPSIRHKTVSTSTTTSQVAPTILTSLGLNPNALQAVKIEGTTALPEVTGALK